MSHRAPITGCNTEQGPRRDTLKSIAMFMLRLDFPQAPSSQFPSIAEILRQVRSWETWILLIGFLAVSCVVKNASRHRKNSVLWILALDSLDAYLRNNFNEPIFLHLSIHEKALNSLT